MNSRPGQASYRDRTQEFLKAVENLKTPFSLVADASSSSTGSILEGPKSTASNQSEFNRKASKIGLGIHQTSQKLAKLAKCKTSVFDDPAVEIQELTSVIKQDITALNSAVVDLQLNFKVHENRRQLFSSSAARDVANPFLRQRPLSSRGISDSNAPSAPWENGSTHSSSLFPR
ncbi:hypothetical protein BHE74_00048462 [Ensete ventricosum]|uniref:Uncharacterized protein n=1 Tax=Ensete ventricosum TaxID=4639 RepID=A0A426YQN2_ENSVE|nr:hypothetical protein B296_00033414 [Ensete ventricosum]RWW13064.1 hypothetical protein GW17_00023243 [Ensete ventricosum]RWW45678.1 hypothetical protein BHE74_00048462 [Ensete ventricosum]RZR99938.1 hypothetical protein BHM03_00029579 [Ensete ventricosum]